MEAGRLLWVAGGYLADFGWADTSGSSRGKEVKVFAWSADYWQMAAPNKDAFYAFLRRQVTLEQVLRHLNLLDQLHGSGQQRRGPCPIHGHATDRHHTFSVHLGKNVFDVYSKSQATALDGTKYSDW